MNELTTHRSLQYVLDSYRDYMPEDVRTLTDAMESGIKALKTATRKGNFDEAFGIASRLNDYADKLQRVCKHVMNGG